jgi:hypothetical protein
MKQTRGFLYGITALYYGNGDSQQVTDQCYSIANDIKNSLHWVDCNFSTKPEFKSVKLLFIQEIEDRFMM